MIDEENVVVKPVCLTRVYLNADHEVVVFQRDFFNEESFVYFPKDAAVAVAHRILELAEEL